MTRRTRLAAIAAFVLATAGTAPAAWAGGEHGDHGQGQSHDKGHSGAAHSTSAHSSGGKGQSGGSQSSQHSSPAPRSGGNGEHNPPGNNGTVKIHQVAGDTSPHNVPHVTCDFYITFFGFDSNQTADLSLAGQAPTGKGFALWSLDDALISTDDAGGGTDLDNEFHVTAADLGLDRLGAPHPQQGYHVKLSVAVDGAPGGAKHKVFWIKPCESTSGNELGAVTTTTGPTGSLSAGHATTGVGVLGSHAGRSLGAVGTPNETKVLGESFTRDLSVGSDTAVLGETSSLPFTGAPIAGLLAGAVGATAAGALMLVAARRRVHQLT